MLRYIADGRDGIGGGSCDTCCCERMPLRPGETNRVMIDYAPWSIPIGGQGLIDGGTFSIEKKASVTPSGGNAAPVAVNIYKPGVFNTAIVGNFNTSVIDPDADPLTFTVLPLYEPAHGTFTLAPDGAYVYTPIAGFIGVDRFFYSVTDGTHTASIAEFVVGYAANAQPPIVQPPFTPIIAVGSNGAEINHRMHTLSFPIAVSPAAVTGDAYRLTIRQPARDCDCNIFYHVSCYDIIIGKC